MNNVFAERLKMVMNEYGYSQADLLRACAPYCERFGVKITKSALSQYLSGAKVPKYDKMKIFEYVFNISADWFAGFSENMNIYHDIPEPDIQPVWSLLNDIGRQKAIDYIVDLAENPKYRR